MGCCGWAYETNKESLRVQWVAKDVNKKKLLECISFFPQAVTMSLAQNIPADQCFITKNIGLKNKCLGGLIGLIGTPGSCLEVTSQEVHSQSLLSSTHSFALLYCLFNQFSVRCNPLLE